MARSPASTRNGSGTVSWSGTATFQRADSGAGTAGSFQLATGQATVTASGTDASGCNVSGSTTVTLQTNSAWGVEGDKKPYTYQIVASFEPPDTVPVTLSACPGGRGRPQHGRESRSAPAIQSGDLVSGLDKTSADGLTYTGSASASFGLDPGESESWTWSMTGTVNREALAGPEAFSEADRDVPRRIWFWALTPIVGVNARRQPPSARLVVGDPGRVPVRVRVPVRRGSARR